MKAFDYSHLLFNALLCHTLLRQPALCLTDDSFKGCAFTDCETQHLYGTSVVVRVTSKRSSHTSETPRNFTLPRVHSYDVQLEAKGFHAYAASLLSAEFSIINAFAE